jgi:hypothetical protein
MNKEKILETCELDMEECLVEMGNQQELLNRLRKTGFYDSLVLLEAIRKIAELREKLNKIDSQLKELSIIAEQK